MYRPSSIIIDNAELKLCDELNKILAEQKVFDVATAYFNISGFQLIKDSIASVERFRLLLGVTPKLERTRPDVFIPEVIYKQAIRGDLEDELFEKDKKDTTVALISFLRNPNVEVRLYDKGFLHGKVYIFDKLAIVGSSNLTWAGFTSNTELNAVLDEAHSKYIRERWFERLWSEAKDFKDSFISLFDESKFGTKEYSPYEIFIKALYELQREDLEYKHDTPEGLPASEVDLANFQDDAVKRIYARLKHYNGVLIADSVGLGKTWIAKKIIEDFGFYRRQRFVIVCPASVDETLWRPELKSIGLSENIIHQEELGRLDLDYDQLSKKLGFDIEDIALIVVDESHNFRNPVSNRYEGLYTLIEKACAKQKPKILLLTATPMNNTHWDLYFQLMLIAMGNDRVFVKEGIFDLERQFKKADKGNNAPIADVLQTIAIRRPRQYIIENYPDAQYKDNDGNWVKIRFPKRKLGEINYSLDETYQGLYHDIADKIEKELTLAYYRLEDYRVVGAKDKMVLGRMMALGGILQTILLKRLESSVEAFRRSVQMQIDFLHVFQRLFRKGKVLRKKYYGKYLSFLDEGVENTLDIIQAMEKKDYLEPVKLEEFDINKFCDDLNTDIKIFEDIKQLVSTIDQKKDAKLIELKRKLVALKDTGKVILFSFYADTIEYLYTALSADEDFCKGYGRQIAKMIGSYPTSRRKVILDEFLNSDTDLLLSTDIISEGQNLQKARIVINYDLHWNPVRMIQRAGRIDRIGSPFDDIFICNFYPEKELESLLELVKILQDKIRMIDSTVGLDASVMGEVINPKVFGIIRDLKSTEEQKERVVQELEAEQFGGGEMFWQPLKNFGLEKLKAFCQALPHGIQSGLEKGFRGVFFYYRYSDDYHLWYLYDLEKEKFLTDKTEILEFIACDPKQPRAIPEDLDVFKIHEKVRTEIEDFFSEGLITTRVRAFQGRVEKFLTDMRDELELIREQYLEDEDSLKDKIRDYLSNLSNIVLTKKRMQRLRKIWRNYKISQNWHILLSQLDSFLEDKTSVVVEELEEFDEDKLKLICVDLIS